MRTGLGLCVLGLVCLYSSVYGQEAADAKAQVQMFCNDPTVQSAVSSAVDKFNEALTAGNKLALYQIHSASKTERSLGSVYSLEFTSRRSDCHSTSTKPWTDCNYLRVNAKPIECNATVHVTEAGAEAKQVDCQLENFIVPERAPCMGCPEDIDTNSEDLKGPVSASISKYNSMSDSTHLFTLNSIGQATRQVVAGFRYTVRFDLRKTTCAKNEHADLNDLCVADENDVEFANCNSTVDVAPWRHEHAQAQLQCEKGPLTFVFAKRRPPGWTPLRNFVFPVEPAAKPAAEPAPTAAAGASAAAAGAKPESSEEDVGSAPSQAPAVDHHCPSEPWKAFSLEPAAAPTEAAVEATAAAASGPAADAGTFSDSDLLA
ncbi:uncharacterized protein V6R79_009615 [Siganus canaliculatus]